MLHSWVWLNNFTVQYSTVQYSTVQYSTVQDRTGQYRTVRDRTGQDRTVRDSTRQDSTGQYGTVLPMHYISTYHIIIGRIRRGQIWWAERNSNYTRKNAQVVTNLEQTCSNAVPTTCQQVCSHCLFPACWQVVNGLLTTCYKVIELNRLVTSCSNNLLSSCNSTTCQQVVSDNLVAT
jgi:hypothetical protein